MNRVLALIAMIACTQAINVQLESETESEGLFDGVLDSVADFTSKTVKSASEAVTNAANVDILPPRDPWHNHPCQGF